VCVIILININYHYIKLQTFRFCFESFSTVKNTEIRIPDIRTDKVVKLITLVAKLSGNISVHNQPISE